MRSIQALIAVFLICAAHIGASAQGGTSSASFSYSRGSAGLSLPPAHRIVVEEFVNYHRHNLPLPAAGEAVALDVRWGSEQLYLAEPQAILQIGITTAPVASRKRDSLRPANLTLVIDKSGSMSGEKIFKVQEALITMVQQLRATDLLSIVVFDQEARVLLPTQPLTDKIGVSQLIQTIMAGGGTEIYKGLMLGYEQARKSYHKNFTNRVVLLTDGISDPRTILQDSLQFNKMGIDLATIGVGLDVNEEMLRALAKQGRGLFHFIADPKDIKKVFIKELESLLSPVARNPRLEISYDESLMLAHHYGYEPQQRGNTITINLDDMNNGLTQVVMLKFKLKPGAPVKARIPVQAVLKYYDIDADRDAVRSAAAALLPTNTMPTAVRADAKRAGAKKDGQSSSDSDNSAESVAETEYYTREELEKARADRAAKENKQAKDKKADKQATADPLAYALIDDEVRKNYTIAALAQTFKDMAAACERQDYKNAEAIASATVNEARQRYGGVDDKDITRVLEIVEQHLGSVKQHQKQLNP